MANYAKDLDRLSHRRSNPRAMKRQLEDVLKVGNYLFQSVKLIERNWRTEVLNLQTPYDPGEDRSIAEMYSQWAAPCRRVMEQIRHFQSTGIKVRGAIEFARHCDEASEIVSDHRPPFDDPEKAKRWREIVEASRPNPRQVRIDDRGRIFEVSGERFNMPGLETEAILEGLADVEAGRIFPLTDLIAGRQ